MITNFEKETEKVTPAEIALIPSIVQILINCEGKSKAITNDAIRKKLNGFAGKEVIKDFRLRVLIHFIRCEGHIVRLCSSSRGYYIGNKAECEKYIQSLEERIDSIRHLYQALREQTYSTEQIKMAI
jgi:hypothetical protein